jgi:hypothetical protein
MRDLDHQPHPFGVRRSDHFVAIMMRGIICRPRGGAGT